MDETTNTGEQAPLAAVRINREGPPDSPYVWQATVTFTTTYNLPDNVVESAILRAIAGSPLARVESLFRSSLQAAQSVS